MLMVGLVLLAIRAVGPAEGASVTARALLVVLGGAAAATSGNVRHAATSGNRLERVSEGRFDLVRGGLDDLARGPDRGRGPGRLREALRADPDARWSSAACAWSSPTTRRSRC